ncbi:Protein elav [Gryllus bimaculatus]|nr:Protein elav [Gryllus bimaculatus]
MAAVVARLTPPPPPPPARGFAGCSVGPGSSEIRELLSDFPVHSVQLQSGTGSGSARAVLEDPEMLEDWDRDRIFLLRGQRVPVSPTPTEMMLCVARLPLTYSETQFTSLVRTYGEVKRSFLMISEKTGESKGYGFVEYSTKEAALQAKNMLDGKQMDNWILCCDWLDSSHVTFDSLHSKCLYVDKLPKDFRDMGEFRKVFSSVVNPPYCQIALKNGCPQDWGLVEYSTSEDAEMAQVTLNGYSLHGQQIRICYYIPGVRAINLYLKLLNESSNKGKATGLLPDPPAPAVFQQLQNLAKQNPVFAQSLQNIIWTQIQNLQNGGSGSTENGKTSSVSSSSSAAGKGKTTNTSNANGSANGTNNSQGPSVTSPNGADNAQAALVILLAAQMQAQMGSNHPSLLGNPQILATLQNLIKQGPPPNGPPPSANLLPITASSQIIPPASPHFQFPPSHNGLQEGRKVVLPTASKNGYLKGQTQKVPLLPNPSAAISPPPGEVAPHPPFPSPVLEDASSAGVLGMPHMPSHVSVQEHSSFWNGLLCQLQSQQTTQTTMNIAQIDGNLMAKSNFFEHGLAGPKSPLHGEKSSPYPQQVTPTAGKIPHPHSLKQNGTMLGFPEAVSGDLQQTINTILSNAQNLNQLLGSLTNAIQTNGNGSGLTAPRTLLPGTPGFSFVGQPSNLLPTIQAPPPPPPPEGTWTGISVAPSPTTRAQAVATMATAQNGRTILTSPVPSSRPVLSSPVAAGRPILGSPVPVPVPTPPKPIGFLEVKPGQLRQPAFQNGWSSTPGPNPFLTSPPTLPPSSPQIGSFPSSGFMPLWSHPGSPILVASPPSGMVTPIGQKRKYNRLLPSPEPSPEGNYIGQHSQGLGGHYADSYFKRKKKN